MYRIFTPDYGNYVTKIRQRFAGFNTSKDLLNKAGANAKASLLKRRVGKN